MTYNVKRTGGELREVVRGGHVRLLAGVQLPSSSGLDIHVIDLREQVGPRKFS